MSDICLTRRSRSRRGATMVTKVVDGVKEEEPTLLKILFLKAQ